MKLTILVDNNTITGRYYLGEPGFSAYIEDGDKRILYDVGYSNAFLLNAQKMFIDLRKLDYLVVCHGHFDHIGGLESLIKFYTELYIENIDHSRPIIIGHPHTFTVRNFTNFEELKDVGPFVSQRKVQKHFDLQISKKPVWITERLVYLGEIPRENSFECQTPWGKVEYDGFEVDDYCLDDANLAYMADDGLVILTGCGHAGIANIVEYARKVCKVNRVIDIVGGLHLLKSPSKELMNETLKFIASLDLMSLHACHCTDLQSKIALAKVAPIKEVGVGLTLNYYEKN